MSKSTDLRVIRTKQSIKRAFINLLNKKQYNKVTIQDIAEEAMINRNTFYLHYQDKDDMLDQLTSDALSKIKESMNAKEHLRTLDAVSYEDLRQLITGLFIILQEDIAFYQVVLGDESIPYLAIKFSHLIKSHMTSGLEKDTVFKQEKRVLDKRTIYIEYMATGLIGIIRFWMKDTNAYTPSELADMVVDMYAKDILELLKTN